MASDMKQMTSDAQNQTLDFMRKGTETFVQAVQSWADGWAQAVNQFGPLQDAARPDQAWMNPQDMIDQVFDFGEQLLSVQREFAHRMLQAAAPAWQGTEQATKEAAQTAQQQTPRSGSKKTTS